MGSRILARAVVCLLAATAVAAEGPVDPPGVAPPGATVPQGPIVTDGPAAPPLCLDQLASMSWPELEQLYRQAEAGTIPEGYTRGRAIYCPDDKLSGVRSRVSRTLWHGKIFCGEEGTLINRWCGFQAIKARVYCGPSWLDGRPSIIMDYSETSRVWADVRDEVREVAPGLYLGLMYRRKPCGPQFKLFFALEACPCSR
jgi:hypothetical protein